MAIERVKIRATIRIGSLSVNTPYIQSFNVTKTRGQISTFSAAMKVSHDDISGAITGDYVTISAGRNAASNLIFTGIVRQAKVSPCYDDPKYVILSISGSDPLSLIQGKKYTRRCRASQASWVAITGLTRRGLKSGKFAVQQDSVIEMEEGNGYKRNQQVGVASAKGTNAKDSQKVSDPGKNTQNIGVTLRIDILNGKP